MFVTSMLSIPKKLKSSIYAKFLIKSKISAIQIFLPTFYRNIIFEIPGNLEYL